jgi:hypothetical protein
MFAKTADIVADAEPSAPALNQSTVQKTPEISSAPPNGNQATQLAASSAPQFRSPQIRTASLGDGAHPSRAVSDTPSHTPTIFEKLFGKPFPLMLAYAAPDDVGLGDGQSLASSRYDRWTAHPGVVSVIDRAITGDGGADAEAGRWPLPATSFSPS